jgi:hypothetical protein
LRRVDARTGGVLAAYTVSGGDAFALADSGTARLVADHGARVSAGAIADVTTRSIAAYRLYEERVRASRRGDDATSAAFLDAAPREDPTFAMAALYAVREPRALHALDRAAPPR